jgi:hypothetical protein
MQEQIETSKTGRRGRGVGRQDRSKQEKVIKLSELDDRMTHLISLYNKSTEASKDLSDAIKAVAEKAGLLASVVRRLVTAKAGDNFDERKREVKQLSLAFKVEE